MKDFQDKFGKRIIDQLWDGCDDAIGNLQRFGDMYNDVPPELADISVSVMEFHLFPKDKREAMLAWLNRKKES